MVLRCSHSLVWHYHVTVSLYQGLLPGSAIDLLGDLELKTLEKTLMWVIP